MSRCRNPGECGVERRRAVERHDKWCRGRCAVDCPRAGRPLVLSGRRSPTRWACCSPGGSARARAAVVRTRLDRAGGYAECLRGLVDAQPVEVDLHQHGAVLGAERSDRSPDVERGDSALRDVRRVRRGGQYAVAYLGGTGHPGPAGVDREAAPDREEPGPHRLVRTVERLRVLPGAYERLLQQILGALLVPVGQSEQKAQQRGAVFTLQLRHGSIVGRRGRRRHCQHPFALRSMPRGVYERIRARRDRRRTVVFGERSHGATSGAVNGPPEANGGSRSAGVLPRVRSSAPPGQGLTMRRRRGYRSRAGPSRRLVRYGTTVTGQRPAFTSRTATEPTNRWPADSEAPTTTASAFSSSAAVTRPL